MSVRRMAAQAKGLAAQAIRGSAAALTVLMLLLLPAAKPALSQTATETLLYLIKSEDKAKPTPDQSIFNTSITVSGNDTRYVMTSTRSGNTLEDLTFRQLDKCRYEISGKRFFNDRATDGLYTVDLSNLNLDASRRSQERRVTFFKLAGAKVCTKKGATLGEDTERFPPEGKCTDYLMTVPVYGDEDASKMLKAVRYMHAHFCQGQKRAF